MVKVEIELSQKVKDIPHYQTPGSVGMDLVNIDGDFYLEPLQRKLVHTGIKIEIQDPNVEAQIRPRSGLAFKRGITVLNSPGTIDPDYRGEIGVILVNLSNETVLIEDGERIAQMVFNRVEKAHLIPVIEIRKETERGEGGFGHTGNK